MFQRLLGKIAKALSTANVPYMVIGGQAVILYGGRPAMTLWITNKLITITASYRDVKGRPIHSF